ncbi:MAG: alpha/beta hydrolase [Segetibacter sp.]|nr:alpha/beta hydrolase [Segetibacter sp.]
MESHYIKYPHSTFHYRQYGNGPKLLFCFHGYGRDSYTFNFFDRLLGKRYTVIAIDLPFHGNTTWDKDLTFQPNFLIQVIQQIRSSLKKEKEKFSLMGYSMGGRIALYLTQILHKHIEQLVLIAPDGLKFNFWNFIGTKTWAGNKLLKYTINNPNWFLSMLNFAEKAKFINRSISSFVHYYMDDNEQRLILYHRWTTMRKFSPNLSKIKRLVNKQKLKIRMMFGRYDNIIPLSGGEEFYNGIEENALLKVVDLGHFLLNEGNAPRIAELFND